MNMDTFKRVVEATGLRGVELATVFEVDRRTIYDWLHGVEPTSAIHKRNLATYTKALENATKRGMLPFPKDVRGAERRNRVAQIASVLRKLAATA